jgi:hypothetical protein
MAQGPGELRRGGGGLRGCAVRRASPMGADSEEGKRGWRTVGADLRQALDELVDRRRAARMEQELVGAVRCLVLD